MPSSNPTPNRSDSPSNVSSDRGVIPKKKGGSDIQNERVSYAWKISKDLDFLALLEAENGLWTEDRKHSVKYSLCHKKNGEMIDQRKSGLCNTDPKNYYWKWHWDYGFCGTSSGYKAKIYNDPRFFTDWKWQIEQCYIMYKQGVTFYGRKNIWKTRSHFIF